MLLIMLQCNDLMRDDQESCLPSDSNARAPRGSKNMCVLLARGHLLMAQAVVEHDC